MSYQYETITKIFSFDETQFLNERGEQEWELVQFTDQIGGWMIDEDGIGRQHFNIVRTYYFKKIMPSGSAHRGDGRA